MLPSPSSLSHQGSRMPRLTVDTEEQPKNELITAFEQAMANAARFNQVRQDFVNALMVNNEQLARLKHLLAMVDERKRNRHLPGWPTSSTERDVHQ